MLFVHTQQQIYKARLSLKEVEPQLSSANFLRIHASFLINLHHVIRITKDDIEMQDHQLIKISRNRKKDVIAAFYKVCEEKHMTLLIEALSGVLDTFLLYLFCIWILLKISQH